MDIEIGLSHVTNQTACMHQVPPKNHQASLDLPPKLHTDGDGAFAETDNSNSYRSALFTARRCAGLPALGWWLVVQPTACVTGLHFLQMTTLLMGVCAGLARPLKCHKVSVPQALDLDTAADVTCHDHELHLESELTYAHLKFIAMSMQESLPHHWATIRVEILGMPD